MSRALYEDAQCIHPSSDHPPLTIQLEMVPS